MMNNRIFVIISDMDSNDSEKIAKELVQQIDKLFDTLIREQEDEDEL